MAGGDCWGKCEASFVADAKERESKGGGRIVALDNELAERGAEVSGITARTGRRHYCSMNIRPSCWCLFGASLRRRARDPTQRRQRRRRARRGEAVESPPMCTRAVAPPPTARRRLAAAAPSLTALCRRGCSRAELYAQDRGQAKAWGVRVVDGVKEGGRGRGVGLHSECVAAIRNIT